MAELYASRGVAAASRDFLTTVVFTDALESDRGNIPHRLARIVRPSNQTWPFLASRSCVSDDVEHFLFARPSGIVNAE